MTSSMGRIYRRISYDGAKEDALEKIACGQDKLMGGEQ